MRSRAAERQSAPLPGTLASGRETTLRAARLRLRIVVRHPTPALVVKSIDQTLHHEAGHLLLVGDHKPSLMLQARSLDAVSLVMLIANHRFCLLRFFLFRLEI
ncbi:unnamed protein product [Ostreobium quekettii]|uniref:Uncharacterized protein n=1 Tax=Ostreobium quekettii TaxID=121088 RepID=A0A8S1J5Y4_9CHLO|nr:unnamed protein product [Ostreobium quekettii]